MKRILAALAVAGMLVGVSACSAGSPCGKLVQTVCKDQSPDFCAKAKGLIDKELVTAEGRPLEGAQRREACRMMINDSVAFLRKRLEEVYTDKHGEFVAELDGLRRRVIEELADPADRKAVFGELINDESFRYFDEKGPAAWRDRAEKVILEHKP